MEVILDELHKNHVDIDETTLSYHINYLLEQHGWLYEQITTCIGPSELLVIFIEMNVSNFGHSMIYLTLVYLMEASEDLTRQAVRLVATPLKNIDFTTFKIEESYFRKIISYVKRMLLL